MKGMGEKVYTIMKSAGVWNMVLGIILIVAGAALGSMNIVTGARLLKNKRNIMF